MGSNPISGTISTKREFYKLWRKGVLGNRPQIFSSLEEALTSNASIFGIREIGKPGGRFNLVRRAELAFTLEDWEREGRSYSVDGGAPPDRVIFQGEVGRTSRGLEGTLAIFPRVTMREAQRKGLLQPYVGLKVLLLMKHFMDENSYEDVTLLMEMYPDSIIEFSTFDFQLGVLPRRNTIVWEVRNY